MMTAADLDAMRAAMLELAGGATCISVIWPGRALWGVEEGGEFVFCIAPPDADQELLADRLVDAILLAAHSDAAAIHARRAIARQAAITTVTRQ